MKQYQFELATQKIADIKQSGSREKKIVVGKSNMVEGDRVVRG